MRLPALTTTVTVVSLGALARVHGPVCPSASLPPPSGATLRDRNPGPGGWSQTRPGVWPAAQGAVDSVLTESETARQCWTPPWR